MDFSLSLPKTRRKKDSTFVIVDIFSNMTHFITCSRTNDATHIVNLFFTEVMRLQGLSRSIVSNQDTKFAGHYWRSLWKKLGMNQAYNSTYHPQHMGKLNCLMGAWEIC